MLLIPSLSWGGISDFEGGGLSSLKSCKITSDWNDWYDKNQKVWNKQEVYIAQCILDHSKNSSTVPYLRIKESCGILAKDKYKPKGKEPEQCK